MTSQLDICKKIVEMAKNEYSINETEEDEELAGKFTSQEFIKTLEQILHLKEKISAEKLSNLNQKEMKNIMDFYANASQLNGLISELEALGKDSKKIEAKMAEEKFIQGIHLSENGPLLMKETLHQLSNLVSHYHDKKKVIGWNSQLPALVSSLVKKGEVVMQNLRDPLNLL